jgi:mannose-6-phosphate isomerase-like protein (cupin superfamily)
VPDEDAIPVDPRDPRMRSFGAITAQQMDPTQQSQKQLAQSASMRTALLVYSGISLKMMVDSDLGAYASSMFMVQYEPDGAAGPHDHPLEECYLIMEGTVDATFDDQEFRLGPGDFAWAGVGCVHSFAATGAPVRWLETQAPQMPPRHAYRFARDWSYLADKLASSRTDSCLSTYQQHAKVKK